VILESQPVLTEANEDISKVSQLNKHTLIGKNLLPPPYAPTRPATHTKNKDTHPGAIDMPKPRRTPAEMQAFQDQQASDKQEEKQERNLQLRLGAPCQPDTAQDPSDVTSR